MKLPKSIQVVNGHTYCILLGELDKAEFKEQCAKCEVKENCKIVKDLFRNVAGDWHALNAEGFFGAEWTQCVDKLIKKTFRDISKICGLALTYGGTSYTLSKNMGCSTELAQTRIDNFFRKLTTLNQFMINAQNEIVKLGYVKNMFGRKRDMSYWIWSKETEEKKRRSAIGYGKRTALNHPIQSTSAEFLKIAMIKVDEFIQRENLNPLYGLSMPQKIDLTKTTFLDILLNMLMSVHDEVDYQVIDRLFDHLVPLIYTTMQLKDVTEKMAAGFDLELDVEYDNTRSFTSSEKYPTAKIYLLNKLRLTTGPDIKCNTYIINFENITNELLEKLDKFESPVGAEMFNLGVISGNNLYQHQKQFSASFLETLGIPIKRVFIEP